MHSMRCKKKEKKGYKTGNANSNNKFWLFVFFAYMAASTLNKIELEQMPVRTTRTFLSVTIKPYQCNKILLFERALG